MTINEEKKIPFERSLIGCVLSDNQYLNSFCECLTEESFSSGICKKVFNAIKEKKESACSVDLVTISEKLDNNECAEVSMMMSETPAISNFYTYLNELNKLNQLFKMKKHCDVLSRMIDSGCALEDAEKIYREGLKNGYTEEGSPTNIFELLPETITDLSKGTADRIETGFEDLDVLLNGGFGKSEMIVIAGRPKMGKTTFGCNIVANMGIRQRKNIIYFSLEMSKKQIVTRFLTSETETSEGSIRSGEPNSLWAVNEGTNIFRFYNKEKKEYEGNVNIEIYDGRKTIGQIISICNRYRNKLDAEGKTLDCICIDHMGLINTNEIGKTKSRYEQMTYVSNELKQMAIDFDCVLLALCQLNREIENRENKEPLVSDLRDSGAIEQDADKVLMLYRPAVYDKESYSQEEGHCYLRLNRNGGTGDIDLKWCGAINRWYGKDEMVPTFDENITW